MCEKYLIGHCYNCGKEIRDGDGYGHGPKGYLCVKCDPNYKRLIPTETQIREGFLRLLKPAAHREPEYDG
jgi:hypothetical protein